MSIELTYPDGSRHTHPEGTTGYEVADLLGGWLTDPEGAAVLVAGWRARTGEDRAYADVALEARREVLAAGFATDLDRVVDALHAVCRSRRRHRDRTGRTSGEDHDHPPGHRPG